MEMRAYYTNLDADARAKLAEAVATSPAYLSQIAYGHRRPSLQMALAIERETGGTITARGLRPDLRADIFGPAPAKPKRAVA